MNNLHLTKREICTVLDPIADVVLAYRPKPKSKPAKKRARRKKKIQRGESSI